MMIISRKEAQAQGLTRYFTGKPCGKGHVSERLTYNWMCAKCNLNHVKARYKKNPEPVKKRAAEHNKKNPEKMKVRHKNWKKNNPDKVQKDSANRRASKANRTLPWLNLAHLFEIESIYKYCAALRSVGLNYHVDHVIPLRGELVSGLHAPWNLQVIPAHENLAKGNRF
jgi:hypothetical protein